MKSSCDLFQRSVREKGEKILSLLKNPFWLRTSVSSAVIKHVISSRRNT